MTYAQILAGGVSFQLYNKSTNAVVPTSISDGDGYIEITEDATSDHNTIYKIDQFVGAVSEITLYTEGDSAKTYALLGASFDESVHRVRTFKQKVKWLGDNQEWLFVEIDGKMYIPYIVNGNDWKRINVNNGVYEEIPDSNINFGTTVFPLTEVILVENADTEEITGLKLKDFDNFYVESGNENDVNYDDVQGASPWRFNQDGFFHYEDGLFLRVNGINHALVQDGKKVICDSLGLTCPNSPTNVYQSQPLQIAGLFEETGDFQLFKEKLEQNVGLELGDDIVITDTTEGDVAQPFTIIDIA